MEERTHVEVNNDSPRKRTVDFLTCQEQRNLWVISKISVLRSNSQSKISEAPLEHTTPLVQIRIIDKIILAYNNTLFRSPLANAYM